MDIKDPRLQQIATLVGLDGGEGLDGIHVGVETICSRLATQDKLLRNISHEIRTPMVGVIGMADLLLQSSPLTEEQREFAETIKTSAEKLLVAVERWRSSTAASPRGD